MVNGNPALVLRVDGESDGVMAIRVEDARISGLYYVRNPQKLTRMAGALTRVAAGPERRPDSFGAELNAPDACFRCEHR